MTETAYSESKLKSLIVDAEYVAVELARGDAVPPEVMTKAKKEIAALVDALLAAKSHVAVIDGKPQLQPSDAQYAALQKAMIELMAALAPVTITSLKDTDNGLGSLRFAERVRRVMGEAADDAASSDKDVMGRRGRSVADKFSDQIFATTLVLLAASICTSALASKAVCAVTCSNEASAVAKALCGFGQFILPTATVLQPAVLGGLGACVYLLRSLHKHIYERTFDVRYQPEYWNRVILGVVSGAIVTLLAHEAKDFGVMGAAAMAFVVGYNTDLLFSLIERLSFALFPKVPPTPVVAPQPTRPPAESAPVPPQNGTRVVPAAPPPGPSDSGNGKPAGTVAAALAVKDAKPGIVKP